MICRGFIALFVLSIIAAAVYGLQGQPHEFRQNQCALCHYDEQNSPERIKPTITLACSSCHSDMKQWQSHPTDIYPSRSLPPDMPLTDGRLTCNTCHYVHPTQQMTFIQNPYFLRRISRGAFFCGICHDIDNKRHIIVENVHAGTYRVKNSRSRVDKLSLACIECHDSYIQGPVEFLGSGTWNHFERAFDHPVGVSYERTSQKKRRNFRSSAQLSEELELFDGKIGCGTCHNIFSKNRNMLVMDNAGSRLCLQCHIK